MQNRQNPIGVFDSGYGGLTILKAIRQQLPQYDYIYLGDNARTPYGTRSFEVVYQYTLQAVLQLFDMGCQLVILACNTASAKALRSIQQRDLPIMAPNNRVLGVIRPSVEAVEHLTQTKHVGILATPGTVASLSYVLEIDKIANGRVVTVQEACPMWVPLVENNEIGTPGSLYFVQKHVESLMSKDPQIDTVILGCTHYPLLKNDIEQFMPSHVRLVDQGPLVAQKLEDYLNNHPEIEQNCSTNETVLYFTTEKALSFQEKASLFLGEAIVAQSIVISEADKG
jgi:glutamate racemase